MCNALTVFFRLPGVIVTVVIVNSSCDSVFLLGPIFYFGIDTLNQYVLHLKLLKTLD